MNEGFPVSQPNAGTIINLEYSMDEISKTNRERWNALARANLEYTIPFLDFTKEDAFKRISRHGIIQDVTGKRVLCLASGGGQDSVAFGLLGAEVSVLDLSDVQLQRDRQAADHHGFPVSTHQGDMRDLSIFADQSFDLVWQVYSLNFSPSVQPVFREVSRVLIPGGIYFLQFANPFSHAVDDDAWDGNAYPLKALYMDGEDLTKTFPTWDVDMPDGSNVVLPGPHEYRHTLSTLLNTMVSKGFFFMGLWEWIKPEKNPQPGSWNHFTQVAPPYLETFWRKL
jgi:SAM-dependent methyltransferase